MKFFCLNLQFFATKKGGGSTRNGRDSASNRNGQKRSDGSLIKAGYILVRQKGKGTRTKAGENVGCGRDHTLFAKKSGIAKYYRKKGRSFVMIETTS